MRAPHLLYPPLLILNLNLNLASPFPNRLILERPARIVLQRPMVLFDFGHHTLLSGNPDPASKCAEIGDSLPLDQVNSQ